MRQQKTDQVTRTSSLDAPTMELNGHEGAIYALDFSPSGESLVSGGHDKTVLLWRVNGSCDNWAMLNGHKGAVLDAGWTSDGGMVLSSSADGTVGIWDAETGLRVRSYKDHKKPVNAIVAAPGWRVGRGSALPMAASVGNDRMMRVWDQRQRRPAMEWNGPAPLTAVAWSEGMKVTATKKNKKKTQDDPTAVGGINGAGEEDGVIYIGGLDNKITAWDVRKGAVVYELVGHRDTITGVNLSFDGASLASASFDGTVSLWDVRPFIGSKKTDADRRLKVLTSVNGGIESALLRPGWSPSGVLVGCGSADEALWIWDAFTGEPKYRLPGHAGTVNVVKFHPSEPIVASCGADGKIFVGELASGSGAVN